MALYSCAARCPAITSENSTPLVELQSSPTDYLRVVDVFGSVIGESSQTFVLGLGVPASRGVLRKTSPVFVPADVNSVPSQSVFGTEWTTQPTIPTKFFRRLTRASGGNTSQMMQLFSFFLANGFMMPPSTSFVLWLISGQGTLGYGNPWIFEPTFDIDA